MKPKTKKSLEQPKKHATSGSLLVSYRHRKIIEGALTGKSRQQTGIELGLSPKSAAKQVSMQLAKPAVQEGFLRILEKSGLTDDFLAQKLRSLVDATSTSYAQKDGIFTDERTIPALETQRKTTELVAKLRGHLQDRQDAGDINIGLLQMVVSAVQQPSPTIIPA